jgi:phosphate:Na+ symporter
MASSLFNDNTNVHDMIRKLIAVAELLYGQLDAIMDNNSKN